MKKGSEFIIIYACISFFILGSSLQSLSQGWVKQGVGSTTVLYTKLIKIEDREIKSFYNDLMKDLLIDSALVQISDNKKGHNYRFNDNLKIENCSFINQHLYHLNRDFPFYISAKRIVIDRSLFNEELVLADIQCEDLFLFENRYLHGIAKQLNSASLSVYQDTTSIFSILNSKIGYTNLSFYTPNTGKEISTTLKIEIKESNLDRISFDSSFANRTFVIFIKDTLNNLEIVPPIALFGNARRNFDFDFEQVQFLNDLIIKTGNYQSSMSFKNCYFKKSDATIYFDSDTLILDGIFPTNTTTFKSIVNKPIFLIATNCDFDKIFLDINNLKVISDSSNNRTITTYLKLLDQFRIHNQLNQFKKLDIDYKNYLAKHGSFWDRFVLPISSIWWNYGYSKQYIVFWTIGFLLLFFILNALNWHQMQDAYPLLGVQVDRRLFYTNPSKYRIRKLGIIFLYTCYIFFSLTVHFDKIKYNSTRFVLFFFLQYLVGLLCLFFIINAIFKM